MWRGPQTLANRATWVEPVWWRSADMWRWGDPLDHGLDHEPDQVAVWALPDDDDPWDEDVWREMIRELPF